MHIRRGDYLGLSHVYSELTIENYYENAMALFPEETLISVLFWPAVADLRDEFYFIRTILKRLFR